MFLQEYAIVRLLCHLGDLLKLDRLMASTKIHFERPRLKVHIYACHIERSYNISAKQVDIRELRCKRRHPHFDAILVLQANIYPPR